MITFPVFLKDLDQRRCVVIGFGEHSEQKVLELIDAGARPVVVTPHADTS
ncbi:MAG: NAD(P)-dependent oxidoreductase [Acidobacteriota bacterium]